MKRVLKYEDEHSLHMGTYGQTLLYTNVHTEREITSKYDLNHALIPL